MQIELARPQDLPAVMEIIAQCIADMHSQGIDQWDEVYPSREIVEEDLRTGSLFVARIDGKCVGSVALNDVQPEQYLPLSWQCQVGSALVIHRLCVHPDWQSRGIARRLMDFAEALATEQGYSCIRLDAYPANPRAISFYKRRGYQLIGQTVFPRRRLPFDCFEKNVGG